MFLFHIDEQKYSHIHFIGIGGVSMSGIASLLLHNGYTVTGSDREESKETRLLESLGATVYIGQRRINLSNPDLVIYTDAIADDNEELIAARELNIPVVSRGVFLGALMRNYLHSIAISGSHGKSTTTSMIAKILIHTKVNPSILLGGNLDEINGNVHMGSRQYLVTEACEFKGNILNYYPSTAIVLNIDADHLDYYRDIDHIIDTFIEYMKHLKKDSVSILNLDDENTKRLIPHIQGRMVGISLSDPSAKYLAKDVHFDSLGHPRFTLYVEGKKTLSFELSIIGKYNMYNALAAIAATAETGIPLEVIRTHLNAYTGLHRRLETVGKYQDIPVITDYGHHPTEIRYTLEALKPHVPQKLICVFQPHTYSRTKRLMNEFTTCFDSADEVIVTEIYAAREKFDPTVKAEDLVERLQNKGANAKYIQTFEEAKDYLRAHAQKGDVILTTGCGNPDVLARMIVE